MFVVIAAVGGVRAAAAQPPVSYRTIEIAHDGIYILPDMQHALTVEELRKALLAVLPEDRHFKILQDFCHRVSVPWPKGATVSEEAALTNEEWKRELRKIQDLDSEVADMVSKAGIDAHGRSQSC